MYYVWDVIHWTRAETLFHLEKKVQHDITLGFYGFGNMGQAIASGLAESGAIPPEKLNAYDLDDTKAIGIEAIGGRFVATPQELCTTCNTVIFATKPQEMNNALESLKSSFTLDTLAISIAAGLSIGFFQERLGAQARVIRVMPNTPALANAGAAGIALSENCTEMDKTTAMTVFGAIGNAVIVDEGQMDAVTALSGSGPAYYFYFVECMVDAGVKLGLNETQATELAIQTLYGAGKLLKESGETASTLRERVTSKGGTTHAALESFRKEGLDALVNNALQAACDRSKELGQ
jgi:pyrroline-5-carboxylate reductase